MIRTSVIPCLSTGLAKSDKIMSMFYYFHCSFGHFESLAFSKWGDKPYTTAVKHFFERYNKVTIFQKSPAILTKKMRTKLNSR